MGTGAFDQRSKQKKAPNRNWAPYTSTNYMNYKFIVQDSDDRLEFQAS